MKSKLIYALSSAFAMAVGIGLVEVLLQGFSGADWAKPIYISVFSFFVILVLPRSWRNSNKEEAGRDRS